MLENSNFCKEDNGQPCALFAFLKDKNAFSFREGGFVPDPLKARPLTP